MGEMSGGCAVTEMYVLHDNDFDSVTRAESSNYSSAVSPGTWLAAFTCEDTH